MKIKVRLSTNLIGSTVENEIEINGEDLVGLSEEEKKDYINEVAWGHVIENMIDWTWEVI